MVSNSFTDALFTAKERDSESGLDNFEARYNSSSIGRFLSPDPENAGADPTNPQSWNMYNYVLNNPPSLTDPSGLQSAGVCPDNNLPVCRTGLNIYALFESFVSWDPFDLPAVYDSERGWISQPGVTAAEPFDFSNCYFMLTTPCSSPQSQANNEKPCAKVPNSPPGASATFNADLVTQETRGMWPATKLAFFDLVFRTGGTFDYKAVGGDQYVDYGNWNFGYVCGVNYPALFCQSVAGANRMWRAALQGKNPLSSGFPFVKSPYGDQAADNQQVRNGIQAQASGCVQ